MRAALFFPHAETIMTKTLLVPSLLLASCLGLSDLAEGSPQVCGRLGGQEVSVPSTYAYSKAQYDDDTGFVTCESDIQILELRARAESLSRTSLGTSRKYQGDEHLITLQPKSDEPVVSIQDALAAIYDPANYPDGKIPYPKVRDGNGLIYIHGNPDNVSGRRTDIYLKSNRAGNTQFMVYCDVSRGSHDSHNCMMGYTDNNFGLNVVIKIDASEVGDYRNVMRNASKAIEPIFSTSTVGG